MISAVHLQHFKAIAELRLSLNPLTVLVGPNGAGKTSVLQALELALNSGCTLQVGTDVSSGPHTEPRLERFRRQDPLVAPGDRAEAQQGSPPPVSIELTLDDRPSRFWGGVAAGTYRLATDQPVSLVRPPLIGSKMVRLNGRRLAEPAYSEEEVPTIQADGAGLAAVMADLAASQPEVLEAIIQHLRRVVPQVRKVRVERAKIAQVVYQSHLIDGQRVSTQREEVRWGHRLVMDTSSGSGVPAEHLSEGTLVALAVITLLCRSPGALRVLLFDDLELGLHPKAQADLIAVVRQVMQSSPRLQIVGATHSPYLLDELAFEEVRLLSIRPDGTVVGGALTEHPDYEQWKDTVRPGELWTSRLEDWLLTRTGAQP